MITRGSTPTLILSVKNGEVITDLSSYDKVELYLSESSSDLKQDKCDHLLTIDKSRMTFGADNKISVSLSQEETLKFKSNTIYYQIRALQNNQVLTTNIGACDIGQILKGDVL